MEVTAGLAESNGSLLPGLWRDSLHVTCGLTACTPGSAPGPTLGNEYRKTLPLPFTPFLVTPLVRRRVRIVPAVRHPVGHHSLIHLLTSPAAPTTIYSYSPRLPVSNTDTTHWTPFSVPPPTNSRCLETDADWKFKKKHVDCMIVC